MRNCEKRENFEMQTVGHGIWRENRKKMENEAQTLYNLECGEKH